MITEEIAKKILDQQLKEKIALKKLAEKRGDPEEWASICKENLVFINDVVKEYGWPSAHLFEDKETGGLVEYAAWLCVQHGDANNFWLEREDSKDVRRDLELTISSQKGILESMRDWSAEPAYVAFLTDRIARNECKPQIYGTQYVANPINPEAVNAIDDPDNIETRRKGANLDSYADYLVYKNDVENGVKDPSWLLPPLVRENDLIKEYSSGGMSIEGRNFKAREASRDPKSLKVEPLLGTDRQREF